MDKIRSCFFTGHRRLSAKKLQDIKTSVAENIEKLITEYDVRDFISGGAMGFDMLAAETVIEMKKLYPHIRLLMYLPCYGQSSKWDDGKKYRYRMILSQADEIVYVTESEYTEGCMNIRNMRMVKDAFFCIAFCIMQRSGTGLTLRHAESADARIINIADEIYDK